jgi:ribulose-phosphate 3-epimerase
VLTQIKFSITFKTTFKTPTIMALVAPSILSADLSNLQSEIELINRSAADWIHFDVMDGVFVPNISFGIPICAAVAAHAQKPIDVHLMMVSPDRHLQGFAEAGANCISVHYEAVTHLHRTVTFIKSLGCKAGVALNPHTPVSLLEEIITELDYVCLMSVNPGYSGQKFITSTVAKTQKLKDLILKTDSHALIQIDGGVNNENGVELVKAGADILVAANFIYKSNDKLKAIAALKDTRK